MKNFLIAFSATLLALGVAILIYEQYQEHEHRKNLEELERTKHVYINSAYIAEGLSSLSQMKPHIEIFSAENGRLPCTVDELGLPTKILALQARSLKEIELSGCGELKATYTELSGLDGGVLFLRAREVRTGSDRGLVWDCESPDFEGIGQSLPSCKYVPRRREEVVPSIDTNRANDKVAEAPATDSGRPATALGERCRNGVALHHSIFTDAVTDRIPNKRFTALGPTNGEVVFFTEIVGARGRNIEHRWFHDDVQIASIPFPVEGDRWRTWSSKQLRRLGPGELRVEVLDGECRVAQEGIRIEAEDPVDPASRAGFMRPLDALETLLAQEKPPVAATAANQDRWVLDGLDESGDPFLIAAIRAGDTETALELIGSMHYDSIPNVRSLPESEVVRIGLAADPLVRGKDGVSAIELAHRMGLDAVVAALVESALEEHPKKTFVKSNHSSTGWRDFGVYSITRGDSSRKRFRDGDTPLIRAVRLGNESAVLALLEITGEMTSGQLDDLRYELYDFDASGRQPIDIARHLGFYGIEQFLRIALERASPPWSVVRLSLTTQMEGSEPGNCRKRLLTDEKELHFFTELADLEGRQIRHEWLFEREVVQTNPFDIRSARAKAHSQRLFSESDVGTWEVRAVDAEGKILGRNTFFYFAATEREKKKRGESPGRPACQGISTPVLPLLQAHAPVSKIKELLRDTDAVPPNPNEHARNFREILETGSISLTRWFLDSGFDIDASVQQGWTPLMIAAMGGDDAMAVFLIAMGADLDIQERLKKRTALIHAASKGDHGMARILLRHGADPNLQDRDGFTALHKAISRECQLELSVSLLEYGTDLSLQNMRGETPPDQASGCFERKEWPSDLNSLRPLRI